VIAGLAGDSGKTTLSLALLRAWRRQGVAVRPFKKGPDYIDAAWLSWAAGQQARNLDTYLMGAATATQAFVRNALRGGINLIEGNRGLFDGFDNAGAHSTAALAKLLRAPVVLVVNAAKVTRTAAALVLGCQKLDPELELAGVILNRVNGVRHEQMLRACIEQSCGIPVLGAAPKVGTGELVPGRHLGLITPEEHRTDAALDACLERIAAAIDLQRLAQIAHSAPPLPPQQAKIGLAGDPSLPPAEIDFCELPSAHGVKIGFLKDSAFTFYYPENLEALERAGAELVPVSSLAAMELPGGLDALYIGGGFPETHGERIAANTGFLASLRAAAQGGLPVYAECGGLMLLARAMTWQGRKYEMAGVLPFEVDVGSTPAGHGYAELLVDAANPFFPTGVRLRGHEFHYSRVVTEDKLPATACSVLRGKGCYGRRDAVIAGNVWASYTHLHAAATPEWAKGLISAALRRRTQAAG
jgi:cobyrinic acid a,c-diamide synthase